MDLFESYDRSYCAAATAVADGLAGLASLPLAERRPRAQRLERDVREAEHVLQRLDMEARSLAPDAARAARAKVADYRADLGKLRAAAAAAAAAAAPDAGRAELGLDADYLQAAAGQRERMLTATERLSRTGERIQQGRAQLLETEELGVSVLSDLQRQRETIAHSREALGGMDASIGQARQVLSAMSRRVTQHKAVMWGVVALLGASIVMVLWAKLAG